LEENVEEYVMPGVHTTSIEESDGMKPHGVSNISLKNI
jgi:hypothetical protein